MRKIFVLFIKRNVEVLCGGEGAEERNIKFVVLFELASFVLQLKSFVVEMQG